MNYLTSELKLETMTPLSEVPEKLRGSIASKHIDEDIYHQHTEQGLSYTYPQIHYHVINGVATITGWLEGVEETKRLFRNTESLQIGSTSFDVVRKQLKISEQEYGLRDEKTRYMFISPWLALNDGNYHRYKGCNRDEKKKLLEKILTGNLLSVSKSLGYTVPDRIEASFVYAQSVKCVLKNTPVIGFRGVFEVNFALPELIGLGKSVSRGYGAVKKI